MSPISLSKKKLSVNSANAVFDFPQEDEDEAKFSLFVKTQEVSTILSTLKNVRGLSSADKQEWLEDNQEVVSDMLESFLEESVMSMTGFKLDPEAMEMSVKLIKDLREATGLIRTMVLNQPRTFS